MQSKIGKPTQSFVPLKEVRDGIAILNDGSLRSIIMASTINFALKSQDEQMAILSQFQNFLNSIDFSIQIFIESRRLDIRPYLNLLQDRLKEDLGDLLKIQTQEYIGFIKHFTETTDIMTKNFFIVVPYSPAILQKNNPLTLFGKKKTVVEQTKKDDEVFAENRAQLEERIEIVEQGITRCGIRVAELGTEEVVELFYKLFNPDATEKPIQIS